MTDPDWHIRALGKNKPANSHRTPPLRGSISIVTYPAVIITAVGRTAGIGQCFLYILMARQRFIRQPPYRVLRPLVKGIEAATRRLELGLRYLLNVVWGQAP